MNLLAHVVLLVSIVYLYYIYSIIISSCKLSLLILFIHLIRLFTNSINKSLFSKDIEVILKSSGSTLDSKLKSSLSKKSNV